MSEQDIKNKNLVLIDYLRSIIDGYKINLENPYTDAADGYFSTNALIWAYHNGIYTGKEGTTESGRTDGCTRAQIVTFLWRDIAPKEAGE